MFGCWMIAGIARNDAGITIEYWRNKELLLYLVCGHRLAMSCKWICVRWEQIQKIDCKIHFSCWAKDTYLAQNGPIFAIAVHMQANLFDAANSGIDDAFGDAKRIETPND